MITLKPPFRAEDMHSLFKVVCKGMYPKISNKYSQDLRNVVKALLQVNPKKRPTCEEIYIKIKSRDKFNKLDTETDHEASQTNILLQTIYVPKNLMFLTDNLPKPKYDVTSNLSNYHLSDNENKTLKLLNLDKIKNSPSKRVAKNNEKLILPNIKKIESSIIDQMKERDRLRQRPKELDENISPKKNISLNIDQKTPSRLRNPAKYQSNERSYSLEHYSHNSGKEIHKTPSLESLVHMDPTPTK